ncbi:MAG: SIR2 family protein [Methylococcaceae bacterium]|nr:SIR2 family protein [Methylococcaceae bacterium]
MDIKEFISHYKNHPILFVGTGISLRYLKNSFTWEGLLKKITYDLKENTDYFFDWKSDCLENEKYRYDKIASLLEVEFTNSLKIDRNGKFKSVNDVFFKNMENGIQSNRLKIYLSELLSSLEHNDEKLTEIIELKKVCKNIGSVITTNYDKFIETLFEFQPLVGNDILLSNPYGSVYKIHGCISEPSKIIITKDDYDQFNSKYELIRAQLLSLFIHNPIVFLGYSIGDENIKSILKTIFTYVEPNSDQAKRIRDNFLLVEYEEGSTSQETCEHDIDIEGFSTIRINKIKTDDFCSVYQAIAGLTLPISAMDIRKVQSIVKEIYAGGDIEVSITDDLDSLKNHDKVLVIGSNKSITYEFHTQNEMISNYFKILEESNSQLLNLINKYSINASQYFPIFGFSTICETIKQVEKLKTQQREKIRSALGQIKDVCKSEHSTIQEIIDDTSITVSNKVNAVLWSIFNASVTSSTNIKI